MSEEQDKNIRPKQKDTPDPNAELRKNLFLKLLLPLILLTLSSFLLFDHSSDRRLAKSDEVAYAAGALEISRGANPIYPHGELSHYGQIGKPPGGLWPMSLSFKLFGHSPLSARLPTLLAALLLLWLLYHFGYLLADHPLGGVLAVLLLLAQAGWLELARKIWLENLLSASFLLALLFHLDAQKREGKRRLIFISFSAATLSYGLWVKHAVGLAPFAAIALAELILLGLNFFKKPATRKHRPWMRLIWTATEHLLALLFFAPWWIYFSLERGGVSDAVGKIGAKLQAESNSKRKPGALWHALSHLESSWIIYAGAGAAILLLAYLVFQLYHPEPQSKPKNQMQADTLVVVVLVLLGLLGSHLLAFGFVSQKLRNWYLLPIVPIFALFSAALIGRFFAIFSSLRPRIGGVVTWTITLLLLIPIGRGLHASYAVAQKAPGPDRFAQLAQRWHKQGLKKLIVDKKNWDRTGYFKPMLYFYFSPLPMQPMKMGKHCDQSKLRSGDFVLVHWTQMDCIKARAVEDIHVTPWWRVFKIK